MNKTEQWTRWRESRKLTLYTTHQYNSNKLTSISVELGTGLLTTWMSQLQRCVSDSKVCIATRHRCMKTTAFQCNLHWHKMSGQADSAVAKGWTFVNRVLSVLLQSPYKQTQHNLLSARQTTNFHSQDAAEGPTKEMPSKQKGSKVHACFILAAH